MRRLISFSIVAAGLLLSLTLFAWGAEETQGGGGATIFGGRYKGPNGHGNVVAVYRAGTQDLDFYAYGVPLNQTNCPGDTQDLSMFDVPVTPQYTFDQYNGVFGASGEYVLVAPGPRVTGVIYLAQNSPCAVAVPYEARTDSVVQGDYDCSHRTLFTFGLGGAPQPAGGVIDLDPSIDFDDAINLLKGAAGAPGDEQPADCAAPGTETDEGAIVGDASCNQQFGAEDALLVALQAMGIPEDEPTAQGNCVPIGDFVLLS